MLPAVGFMKQHVYLAIDECNSTRLHALTGTVNMKRSIHPSIRLHSNATKKPDNRPNFESTKNRVSQKS